MKIFTGIFVCILIVLAGESCRSTKKLQTAINKKDTQVVIQTLPESKDSLKIAQNVMGNVKKNHINFKTFSAKIKVQYEDSKGKQPDVNAFVRMMKDSVIWISINATFLSVEAFRVMITKNSVMILNKLDKQVEYHPFGFIEQIVKIPLDFSTLEDLILGNPILVGEKIIAYRQTEDRVLISTVGKIFKNLLTLNGNTNFVERSKLDDLDLVQNRTGDLTYGSYENKTGLPFSTIREITVAEKTKVDIKLDFKQYEFNKELTFPFSVPKNYKTK